MVSDANSWSSGWSAIAGRNESEYYGEIAGRSHRQWENTSRKDYQADLWYNRNRNNISLKMIEKFCIDQVVLSIGGRSWMEEELLDQLSAREIVRTDLTIAKGVTYADALDLPFPDESFDFVICREVLEHVKDSRQAVLEAFRVLKPDGYYYITTPNGYNIAPDGVMHVRAFTPLSLLKELSDNEFIIIDKRGDVPNLFSALLPLSSMGFENVLEEFKMIEELVDKSPSSYYTGTILYVLAQKVGK